MTYLLALIAGIVGAALGWIIAAVATNFIGGFAGVSDFEGGRGMLAVWGVGPIGGLAGLILGVVLVLRKRGGFSAGTIAWRVPIVIAGIAALVAGALWWMYETRPVLNCNGPAPRLAFEVRLPPGLAAETGSIKAELHTEKNKMPASMSREPPRMEDGRAVITGSVELNFRSGWRLLEVKVPGQDDRLVQLGPLRKPAPHHPVRPLGARAVRRRTRPRPAAQGRPPRRLRDPLPGDLGGVTGRAPSPRLRGGQPHTPRGSKRLPLT